MKNVRSLLITVVCIGLAGVAFSQLHQVDATSSDGLDSGAETERARLIAALPWLANCTAESTDPCDAPFDAEDEIKSHLRSDGVGFNILCWLFPRLPWCHKRIPTLTTSAETTAPTHSTGTMETLSTASRTSAGRTSHRSRTTSTSAITESTATGSKVTTTSGGTSPETESTKHRRTTASHHTTHSPSHNTTETKTSHFTTWPTHNITTSASRDITSHHITTKRTTTTEQPSTTVKPSGDDKFNVKWFFVGFATMFGVALIILLIALLFVRYRRAHPSGGYSSLESA